jgi:hypothetical protein
MTTRRRLAATVVRVLAWVLLAVGLSVITLNSFPPSLRYALLWLGVMAIARGIARLAAWIDVGVDLSLLFACFFGLEIGGLSAPLGDGLLSRPLVGSQESDSTPRRLQNASHEHAAHRDSDSTRADPADQFDGEVRVERRSHEDPEQEADQYTKNSPDDHRRQTGATGLSR